MEISAEERAILTELPQIPFIIDQVGEALAWAKEDCTEEKFSKILRITGKVIKWVNEISEPNFYKVDLVIAAILSEIENAAESPKFKAFDSASKSVENTLKLLSISEKEIEERGCFKATTLFLANLAKNNEECLAIALSKILDDLLEITEAAKEIGIKSPITPKNYITLLGYSLAMANIRMSNFNLLNYNRDLINSIEILLNETNY